MASLENKKIKDTYQGLLKTDDNAAIDGAVEITDGAGNGTGVTISNDGQVTATGTVSFGSLKDTGENITITKFVDEADGISLNDNDTTIPTSAAVKDYVDTNVTAQDLDFQGDTGTGAVDLDSQTLDIAGGTGIDTAASGQTLTVNIDSTVATLSDTQTLTNKTIDADNNTVSNLEVDNLKSGVLDTDLTTVSVSDDTLASAKAIKTYVDSNITAQDLDITDGTTTSAVDLDSQTLTIQGTANEVEVSLTDQTFTVGLPTSITTNLTGNADTASALETARTISLSGDVAGSVSFDGSANADITATIQANSVALGTDTTGDYVSGLGTGTGVTIGSNTGEGSSPTISVDYGSTANTAVQGNTSLTIQGTANEIEVTGGGVTLGSGGTVTVGLPNDVSLGGSLTIAQNLTVNGTTTTVNTDTLSVEDPLIELARDNSENSVDVGLYGKYSLDSGVTTKYSGLFKDASDSDKFKLFKGLEVEPTSTVNTAGTGYTKGDLVVNDLDAVTISGTISTAAQTNITSVGTLTSLSVSGTTDLGSTITNGDITIDVDDTPSLHFKKASSADILASINVSTDAGSGGKFVIQTKRNGNTPLDRFTIDDDGNVGIGTASPSAKLDVNGDIKLSAGAKIKFNDDRYFTPENNVDGAEISANGIFKVKTGATPVERFRIDSSGNVGIGGSAGNGYRLELLGSSEAANTLGLTYVGVGASAIKVNSSGALEFGLDAADGSTERMRIDSSGNVGIGESNPENDNRLHIKYSEVNVTPLSNSPLVVERNDVCLIQTLTSNASDAGILFGDGDDNDVGGLFYLHSSDAMTFRTATSERMRITSVGDVLVGTTSVNGAGGITVRSNASGGSNGAGRILFNRANTTATSSVIEFNNNSSAVGSITHTNTATAYNTSSDYRLKENVVDMTGALDRVDQLKPKRFNFIADEDTTVDGFLAHQVQDIVPEAVTGEKDAVDEDGNDIYQGIDQSKLVPLLVGAIKELNAKVAALEAQINN